MRWLLLPALLLPAVALPGLHAQSPAVQVPPVALATRAGAAAVAARLEVAPPVRPAATRPAGTARRPAVVLRGNGRLQVVPGYSARTGPGPLRTYEVAVEGGLGIPGADVAAAVERALSDPRSWGAGGRMSFRRVGDGGWFRVVLASPATTDRLCAPLRTNGRYSCASGRTAVLNSRRWLTGAASYAGRLDDYRDYVVNHEVGHVLGHAHASCPRAGQPAPVMVQQTKGTGGCTAQPWPFP